MIPDIPGLTDDQLPENGKRALARMSALINDAVKVAGHSLMFCNKPSMELEDLAPAFLLRQIAAQGVGVSAVVQSGVPEAVEPLVRAMYEAQIQLDYMLESDTTRRARAYWVSNWKRQLSESQEHDPSHPKSSTVQQVLKADAYVGSMKFVPDPADVQGAIAYFQGKLAEPQNTECSQEYDRVKQANGRVPNWFALFQGPRDIRALAKAVSAEGVYHFLYRRYSGRVHAANAIDGWEVFDGRKGFRPIRFPMGIEPLVLHAIAIIMHAATTFAERFGTPHQIAELQYYYIAHIREPYRELIDKPVFVRGPTHAPNG